MSDELKKCEHKDTVRFYGSFGDLICEWCHCGAIRVSHQNWKLPTRAPSITKEQLLAIITELTEDDFKKDITHDDEMLKELQARSMKIGHLRTKAIMEQRIEEMFK